MSQVLSIASYRNKRKEAYLARFEKHLQRFLIGFAQKHFQMDFQTLSAAYQEQCRHRSEQSWDYLDLRDELEELMEKTVIDELHHALSFEWWYDPRWLAQKEILERLLAIYITGQVNPIAS